MIEENNAEDDTESEGLGADQDDRTKDVDSTTNEGNFDEKCLHVMSGLLLITAIY